MKLACKKVESLSNVEPDLPSLQLLIRIVTPLEVTGEDSPGYSIAEVRRRGRKGGKGKKERLTAQILERADFRGGDK
jgi:hypothetical protein